MNREALYLEIGNIDDDLIQAATEISMPVSPKVSPYRIAGVAACICLICGSILFYLQRDTIYINEISAPTLSKVIVPTDENTKIVPMTYQNLLAYYGLEQLPNSFGKELRKTEQSDFVLYQDYDGNYLYDTNTLYYSNIEKSMNLSITLSKTGNIPFVTYEKMKQSKIDGISITLATLSNTVDNTSFMAYLKSNDLSIQIICQGLSEDAFISTIKEFIRILK